MGNYQRSNQNQAPKANPGISLPITNEVKTDAETTAPVETPVEATAPVEVPVTVDIKPAEEAPAPAETTPVEPTPIVETPTEVVTPVEPTVVTTDKVVEAPTVETTIPVVKQNLDNVSPKTTVVDTAPKVDPNSFEAIIANVKVNGSNKEKALINTLEQYAKALMPGKPIDSDVGVGHQYRLWQAIFDIATNNDGEDFRRLWNIMLMFFSHYEKGVFNMRYVYRFAHAWMWSEMELNTFQKILNLILLTAVPSKRAEGLKSVDLVRTLESFWSEEARQRIYLFYTA